MVEKNPAPNKMPDEVFSVLYDAALMEDNYRSQGVHPDRIKRLVDIPMKKALTRLAIQKVKTELAFPPEKGEEESVVVDPQLTPEEDAEADRMVNTGVYTYDEAIKYIRERR